MSTISYIERVVDELTRKHDTRDPYELCRTLGIKIRYKELHPDIKAYYTYQSRIRSIVLNNRISESVRKILVAHELGHDRLHQNLAMLKSIRQIELFEAAGPIEYEANVFAAELLIEDNELLELLNDEDKSFFGIARELYVPAELLDFKFRVLKHKGYRVEAPYIANGDFLKHDIDGCFSDDDDTC